MGLQRCGKGYKPSLAMEARPHFWPSLARGMPNAFCAHGLYCEEIDQTCYTMRRLIGVKPSLCNVCQLLTNRNICPMLLTQKRASDGGCMHADINGSYNLL